jgi:hypothetical protein
MADCFKVLCSLYSEYFSQNLPKIASSKIKGHSVETSVMTITDGKG